MADSAGRTATRALRAQAPARRAADALGAGRAGTRHPLVAVAMVLPLAVLLAVAFGGWDAVVLQASSVAGMLGR
ncbi:hypothetical protein ACFP1Z_24155 [Streptomyces gamaensis]|uniref:ABC transporter permease n=1 Tax=Streptomyces gamaensis TaxID=1763542 RepID=A0ABW0Z3D3_9ACTN